MTLFERTVLYYVLPIVVAFGSAFVLHWLSQSLARRMVPLRWLTRRQHTTSEKQSARHQTVVSLVSGTLSVSGFTVALFVALAQFISVDTLVWMIGLFGAGFGFSARPFIADYMTGVAFIADDSFDVGEKIEVMGIEGVVETVTLRMTTLRGTNGEVYTIPNGEIRAVRNFSRGNYTPVKIIVRIAVADLQRTLLLLKTLGEDAPKILPDLIEPWQVFTEEGVLSNHSDLTIFAKMRFGKGAQARPHLLAYVQEHLTEAEIDLME
jgi:moderate conductance mechanosensitive channel